MIDRTWELLCAAPDWRLRRWSEEGDDRAHAELVRREVAAKGESRLR